MKRLATALLLLTTAGLAGWCEAAEGDEAITRAAESSYNFTTVLERRVQVKVIDSIATLTGTVSDPEEKLLAKETLDLIPGVKRVENRIEIQSPGPARSDAWIAQHLRQRLRVKNTVSPATEVAVKNGIVTLSGTAESAQAEAATACAKKIPGVKSVENQLSLQSPPKATESPDAEKIDDISITTQVKWAVRRDPTVGALKPLVVTNRGIVALAGEVRSTAERDLVTRLAQEVRGVKGVNNHVLIRDGGQ